MKNIKITIYSLIIGVWVGYIFLTFLAPQSSTNQLLNITPRAMFLIRISIAIPYLVTWLMAALAFTSLYKYYRMITESPEGQAFRKFFLGIAWLLLSLIIGTLISSWKSYLINSPYDLMSATVVLNYVYVIFPLLAFIFFSQGALIMRRLSPASLSRPASLNLLSVGFSIFFSSIFLWLVFTNTERQISSTLDGSASYYLSDPFILLTVALPMFIGWYLGILASFDLYNLQRQIRGEIYQNFLRKLSFGVIVVVFGSAILQLLLAVGTGRLIGLGLITVLLIVYFFLAVQAVGYFFIASASKRLMRLEKL